MCFFNLPVPAQSHGVPVLHTTDWWFARPYIWHGFCPHQCAMTLEYGTYNRKSTTPSEICKGAHLLLTSSLLYKYWTIQSLAHVLIKACLDTMIAKHQHFIQIYSKYVQYNIVQNSNTLLYKDFWSKFICIYLWNCFMKMSLQSSEQIQLVILNHPHVFIYSYFVRGLDLSSFEAAMQQLQKQKL